jgi:hypothetical protein
MAVVNLSVPTTYRTYRLDRNTPVTVPHSKHGALRAVACESTGVLHAMQAQTVAECGPTLPRVPLICDNSGWTWLGVAWCLASLALPVWLPAIPLA